VSQPFRFSIVVRGGSEADLERLEPAADGADLLHAPGLQRGLDQATGEVAVFLAAGSQPLPGWMARYREAFADPSLAAAAGRVFPRLAPGCGDWARVVMQQNYGPFDRFDLGHFDRKVQPQDQGFLPSQNFAVRFSTARANGGFEERSPLLRRLLDEGERVHYLPSATVCQPIPADFPLEQRFADWWQEHGRRQVRFAGRLTGLARMKARWKAARKSRRYGKRMDDWPQHSAPWTTLAAKHHLHHGRDLELREQE